MVSTIIVCLIEVCWTGTLKGVAHMVVRLTLVILLEDSLVSPIHPFTSPM